MSSHHPSSSLLKKFAEANLDGSLASVVSSHVERCLVCQKSVRSSEQELSLSAFGSIPQVSPSDVDEAWKNISSRKNTSKEARKRASSEVVIDGVKFELPRALQKVGGESIKWMPFGKGGKISKLGGEKGTSLFLIYLASNEEVPLHSHEGTEHSYVISGSYSADGMTFNTGDFSVSTHEVTHAPRAGSEAGCLLLSSVENRLNFLRGWLKPFNALLWGILNLRVKLMR